MFHDFIFQCPKFGHNLVKFHPVYTKYINMLSCRDVWDVNLRVGLAESRDRSQKEEMPLERVWEIKISVSRLLDFEHLQSPDMDSKAQYN